MCTLIVATRRYAGTPLWVAANRDEALDRASGPPRVVTLGDRRVLAPQDLVAGGTWLGLNDRGLFVGITNRFGVEKNPALRSRGALVMEALGHSSAASAFQALGALSAQAENGFHLVLADASAAFLIRNDGVAIQRQTIDAGVLVVTERSYGAGPTDRPALIDADLAPILASASAPEPSTLFRLLQKHAVVGLEGVCVHAPELNYGTRSSTVIRLDQGGQTRYFHAQGPPCTNAYQDLSALIPA